MVHFTCDLCGKDLTASGDPRFVVKIAAYAGFDPTEISEDDLDDDQMEAIAEILQREQDHHGPDSEDDDASSYKGFRYDLCPSCHSRFIKDPLNRDLLRTLDFSEN
jgi:hypothetical protein